MGFWDKWQDILGQQNNSGPTYSVDLPEAEGIVRYRMIFYGRVQGVGFRYTMKLEASGLSITGWVHNHYDGSVIAELQGENKAIRMLIYRIQQGHYIRIDDIKVESVPADPRESVFSVK